MENDPAPTPTPSTGRSRDRTHLADSRVVKPRSGARRPLVALGLVAAAAGVGMGLLHLFPQLQLSARPVAMVAAFIPSAVLAWLVAVVCFAFAGRRWARVVAVLCAVALAAQAVALRAYLPHPAPTAEGEPLRVMSANLFFGRADPDAVADAVRAASPDVIVFTEYSQALDSAATTDALKTDYPYRLGSTPLDYAHAGVWDASGTQVWSRPPITLVGRADSPFEQMAVRVERPGGPIALVAAHPLHMVHDLQAWDRDAAALADVIRPHLGEHLVVAGDFNATLEHATLRRVLALGLTHAGDQSGAGWLPTFPADGPPGPIIGIDHVLVGNSVVARGVRTVFLPGTDHLALVADLVVVR